MTYVASGTYTKEEPKARGVDISKIPNLNKPAVTSTKASADESKRASTAENSTAKRTDELKALNLIPFEALDKSQQYANPGDTMPIVFCKRENDAGGVWISPPLLDSSSNNFLHTFVFLISHGQTGLAGSSTTGDFFFGSKCLNDISIGASITITPTYSNDAAVCPIGSFSVTCDHTNFSFASDPLGVNTGDSQAIRTVNEYATGAVLQVKPLYPDGYSSPSLLERYTITVSRTDNSTGTTTTVGTVTTSATGGISSISDTTSAGNYTYSLVNTAVHTASALKPETILIEFQQQNTFPTSYDRTASYTNIQLVVIEGNLYDSTKAYSAPTDLKQLHIFVREGIQVTRWRYNNGSISTGTLTGTTGPSNSFADLIYYWFSYSGKQSNTNFTEVSFRSIATCALFHEQYGITYNAYLTNGTNFFSYVQTVSPMLLCSMYTALGLYYIKPLLPLTDDGQIDVGALTPAESFTDNEPNADSVRSSIIAGTYSKQYKNGEDRLPIQVVVTWRGQSTYNLETTQTTTVRYSDYAADVPEETYDMSEFCTNAAHAEIFAKYVLATRRYSLHTVTFQTARNVITPSLLNPLDLISVSLSRVNSAGDSRTETEYYLVDSLEFEQTGVVTIKATHFPLNGSGASIISNSILSGSFEVTT